MKMTVFWGVVTCSLVEIDRVLEVLTASIALLMLAVSTSETSCQFFETKNERMKKVQKSKPEQLLEMAATLHCKGF
jgi:hypothetical protein